MSRFVKPEIVRIPLSGGDWIEIKRRLTAGETKRVQARMLKNSYAGEKMEIDFEMAEVSQVIEYLADWSFVDEAGQPVKIRDTAPEYMAGAVRSLDPDTFREIVEAIAAHEKTLEEEKKPRATVNAS
jgi:hypothetical protein